MTGLPLSLVVNTSFTLTALASPTRNFGIALLVGSSDVIDTTERVRSYSDLSSIADDFGTSAEEYLAANVFFAQSPQPSLCYVGRWAESATAGRMYGGPFNALEQVTLVTTLQAITTGSMKVPVDGADVTLTGLDFHSIVTLNGAATVIATALSTHGTCTWDSVRGRFVIRSATTGAASTIGYAHSAGSGVDVSATLRLVTGVASVPVAGIVAETPLAATQIFDDLGTFGDWYSLQFADTSLTDSQHYAVASYIEAASQARVYGVTTQNASVLDSTSTTDIAYVLKSMGLQRTYIQYSSYSPYAAASFFGRAATVDFNASNTTITLMFKAEPLISPENLTTTQAAVLKSKNCNVYATYQNGKSIIQYGTMANGAFFDEIHGADWFTNALQVALWNRLYTSTTKIPQTDSGIHGLAVTAESVCVQAVANGWIAPGTWNGPPIGPINTGDYLPKGYYVYQPSVDSQSQADREARKAPPMQIMAKLAGAVHSVNVVTTINR